MPENGEGWEEVENHDDVTMIAAVPCTPRMNWLSCGVVTTIAAVPCTFRRNCTSVRCSSLVPGGVSSTR